MNFLAEFEWHFERLLLPGVIAGLCVMVFGFVITICARHIDKLIHRKKEGNHILFIKILGFLIGIAGLISILVTAI